MQQHDMIGVMVRIFIFYVSCHVETVRQPSVCSSSRTQKHSNFSTHFHTTMMQVTTIPSHIIRLGGLTIRNLIRNGCDAVNCCPTT